MIIEIEGYWEDEAVEQLLNEPYDEVKPGPNKIFLVHGRDTIIKKQVDSFLKALGLFPVILHEQSNQGLTIIEKFEKHANVDFAVALLTPDDVGGLQVDDGNLESRARQNVVLELGYFIGRLGRDRVCAMTKGDVELPSDYTGIVYISLDDLATWKGELARELKAAGFEVNTSGMSYATM